MVTKKVLILSACLCLAIAFNDLDKLERPSKCRSRTIVCSCMDGNGVQLNVTVKACWIEHLTGKKSVCKGEAILTKCKRAYLSSGRHRRTAVSQTPNCINGTLLPSQSSSALAGLPQVKINGGVRYLFVGENVTFKCTVNISKLPATVSWLLNGSPLVPEKNRHKYLDCNTALLIKGVLRRDAGKYTCVVKNELGQANASSYFSSERKLQGPYIEYVKLEGNSGNTAYTGSTVNLTCKTQGYDIQNTFLKNNSQIKEGDQTHYQYFHMPDREKNVKILNLEIKNVTEEDTGNYTCLAYMNGLSRRKSFHLQVDEEPLPSNNFTLLVTTITGVLGTVIIVVLLYCFVKKKRWLFPGFTYSISSRTTNQQNPQLQGLCEDMQDAELAQVVKKDPEIDYEPKYDVFICYSYKDVAWVKELFAELEKRGFTCCIDFKDFVPGASIVDNISEAICYSRKTVAVLTPDSVQSNWWTHELQQALTRIRFHQVVPIVYKSCEIPLILQDRTYLDWENCHVKPYFWDQLDRALRQPNDY